ncbi:MAG: DNA lyase [Candidatus Kapaibacterium sp.]
MSNERRGDDYESAMRELRSSYEEQKGAIRARLDEFRNVPSEEYFYEMCFCLCTPQSKARHALLVVEKLKEIDFQSYPCDVADILGNSEHYIRFHRQKSYNLQEMQSKWSSIEKIIASDVPISEKRDHLAASVRGMGMKEAAHFLRNIGIYGVAILDRHILKHLTRLRVISEYPMSLSRSLYREIEDEWLKFCRQTGIPMEEMDLLFWSMETGEILK